MNLDELPTPALVIDDAILRRNIARVAMYAKEHNLRVRPHTKTHKSAVIGRTQLEAGACGLTVAKAGEAAVMAECGGGVLLAYPPIGRGRAEQLIGVAMNTSLRVAIDAAETALALASAARAAGVKINALVDVDVGMHRTGVQSPQAALELAQVIAREDALRLDGLLFYPGQIWAQGAEQAAALRAVDAILAETLDLFAKSGLPAPIVSGGSTPTLFASHLVTKQTEIRPGTYVFNDMNSVHGGFASQEDCAATIVCTVVSTAVPGQIVLDAGTKTLTSDRCGPAPDSGHGRIVEYPDAVITKLTEEHAQVSVKNSTRVPKLGERVRVIPNHICPCVNLQDNIWLMGADSTVRSLKVDARGKLT